MVYMLWSNKALKKSSGRFFVGSRRHCRKPVYGAMCGPGSTSNHSQPMSWSSSNSTSPLKFTIGLDGGCAIGIPKSPSLSSDEEIDDQIDLIHGRNYCQG